MDPIVVMACGLPPLPFPSVEFAVAYLQMAGGLLAPEVFVGMAEEFDLGSIAGQIVKACLGLPV